MSSRHAVLMLAVPVLALVASCASARHSRHHRHHDCDADDRLEDCAGTPEPGDASADASTDAPTDATFTEAGHGRGVLCSPCNANADCTQGSLCILRGGAPVDAGEDAGDASVAAGAGFCGSPCASSNDCPADFTCAQIGNGRQCLPTTNGCQQ